MKEVEEDNAVSSLHPSHGIVEIPPSSHHDSLEKLWDEEEEPKEIETMMKLVPFSYKHYLNVFSMVKEEKHSPHNYRYHHIKLEGSLPQVGAI
ncbi:hypothetical protein O181_012083 [Austropuccinia psidii MF-1]|uniref:Uncharacterized protein n=1 Tax=Austropuccinia psidii MF-1 TaxID=1389203 RepID=A0A9Q3BW41_9BASI|nr:hypothetical protein [Austropuccinia psidii MF-1]